MTKKLSKVIYIYIYKFMHFSAATYTAFKILYLNILIDLFIGNWQMLLKQII